MRKLLAKLKVGGMMAETNGSGLREWIEATLAQLAQRQKEFAIIQEHDHEEHQRDFKQLMTWQVLMQDKMEKDEAVHKLEREEAARERKRLDELWANTDKRIADLVSAMGQFIRK